MNRLLRPAMVMAACAALSTLLLAADAPSGTITVWDGETAVDGKSWVAPKADTNVIKVSDTAGPSKKKALEFKGAGEGYIGCGWNWCGWYPADSGTDISGCDRMRFNIKVTGDAKPGDFKLHLISNNAKSSADVNISNYLSASDKGKIDDGEWHEITIPLKDLYGDKKDFDPKLAWEFDVSEWSQDKKDFTTYIDMVQFLPPEAKPAETKPAETKPAETKPAETKPAETKPAETKPAETKPDVPK